MENITSYILNNTAQIIEFVKDRADCSLLTPEQNARRAGIVTFKVHGQDNAEIYRKLMKKNVICANRKGGIRFSPHFYTKPKTIKNGLEILNSII